MRTIEEAILAASACLKDVGVEDPRLESEFLLAAFLHVSRTRMILDRHQALPSVKISAFQEWLRERQKRKPLAYVSGEQPFRDWNFNVTPDVLIPRPETELLVERALMLLDGNPQSEGWCVVDVGTGSGNIALSLAAHPKARRVIGIDVSQEALHVARSNEKQMKRDLPVEWLLGNLLAPLQKRRIRPDLIVANLPYIRTDVLPTLEPELYWEPRLALDGGDDGLRLIEPCIEQAAERLGPGGVLLMEIGADQSQAVMTLVTQNALWADPRIFMDLAGHPRILQARRKDN